MSSRRLSLGGSALREISTNSSARRLSLGGARRSNTPLKDRREALEDWRRTSRGRDPSSDAENVNNDAKRPRTQLDCPPLPPSTAQKLAEPGMTALERYRLKKQLKQQQQEHTARPPRSSAHEVGQTTTSRLVLSEDFDDEISFNSGAHTSTPASRRRLANGRARRRSHLPPKQDDTETTVDFEPHSFSQNSETSSYTRSRHHELSQQTLSQLTTESEANSPAVYLETVGGSIEAGLRSRLREMEHRIDQLEKDKMTLLVAKAPLEARLKQKEEEWETKEKRLVNEVDALRRESREAEDRFRDLQASYDGVEGELKRMRLEAKKPSNPNTARGNMEQTRWGRMYQNDESDSELKKQLKAALDDNKYLRGEKVSLEKELHGTKIEFQAVSRALDELQLEYDSLAQCSSENRDAEIQLERLTTEHIATSAQLNAVYQELADTKARTEAEARAQEEDHKKSIEDLRFQLSVATARASNSGCRREGGTDDTAVLQARNEEHLRRIADLEAEVRKGEEIRRQMHNRIQELRGNIRVFVRTRPFLPGDSDQNEPAIEVAPDGESLAIEDARTSKLHNFSFDKVFPPSAGQDQVFMEVADFVQSALDGYHVCLFSYGQTGSGKTHTMQGSGNSAMRGIIPRAVEQILNQARKLQSQKWDFNLCASFLEIYNEELKDLLAGKSNGTKSKLSIKRSKGGKSYVDGLSELKIDTNNTENGMEQLHEIMTIAAGARSVASTKMNAQSSRSHSVFMLHLRGYNEETGAEVHGALNLCDLAGKRAFGSK